jgi:hypothetical protein
MMEWLKQIFSGGDSVVPELVEIPEYSGPVRNADLPTQWNQEVYAVRMNRDPDVAEWSSACRVSWARAMLEILDDEEFWQDVADDDLIWLMNLVEPEYEAMPDDVQELARWFRTNLNELPRETFSLPDGRDVGGPVGWYVKITLALALWSDQRPGWQEVVCGWLEQLRLYVSNHDQEDANIIDLARSGSENLEQVDLGSFSGGES